MSIEDLQKRVMELGAAAEKSFAAYNTTLGAWQEAQFQLLKAQETARKSKEEDSKE